MEHKSINGVFPMIFQFLTSETTWIFGLAIIFGLALIFTIIVKLTLFMFISFLTMFSAFGVYGGLLEVWVFIVCIMFLSVLALLRFRSNRIGGFE